MMIRAAKNQDIPSIVNLLQISLGEGLIPKSEQLWKWKHIDNPFGPSPVWVVEEKQQLIGVRAFMRWKWTNRHHELPALRAVDTATHPNWQGKGIFKKLTLHAVEACRENGDAFIFNTPNNFSLPGYLKMGWKKQGRLALKIKPIRPLALAKTLVSKNPGKPPIHDSDQEDWEKIIPLVKNSPSLSTALHTPISTDFIRWRYAECPLFNYSYHTDFESYLLIFRIKTHKNYHELRITDLLPLENGKKINKSHLAQWIKKVPDNYPVDFITYSAAMQRWLPIPSLGWWPSIKKGPLITIRDLNIGKQFDQFFSENAFGYSLGDLELF